jgi:hypothetical protein
VTAVEQTIAAFLGHASVDAEAGWIDPLEQEMQLRGIAVWRDKHQLLAGHHNWDEIRSAIDRCTVFVVVVTPSSLERPAIWDELRHADLRWKQDHSFPMIPVRIGVSRDELNEHCRMKGVHRLSDQQDIEVSLDPDWNPASDLGWAARVAGQILASAIDRHLRLNDRELVVAVRTMTERTLTAPDLDLDWAACFDPEPDEATWDRLLAALEDLADAIKRQTRQERFSAHLLARIGVGVALGWTTPRTSARKIDVVHADARGVWPSDAAEADDGHTDYVETEPDDGDPSLGTVLVSVGRDAYAMYERSPAIARAGHLLEVNRPEEHPMTAETAAAAALRIGRTIRRWCDTADVRQVQLAGAMPIGLAVLIGRQLNATVDVVVFHVRDGVYVAVCRLPGGSRGAGGAGRGASI